MGRDSMDRDRDRDRKHHNRGDHGPPGAIKRFKMEKPQHPEQRILDRIRSLNPNDVVPKKYEVKKFVANTRLYVGNIANDVTDDEVKELFQPFGELDELFINRDKNFAFLKFDYRTSAEKARAEVDGMMLKNRALKVRFAPASVRIRVKNLAPSVTNELLEYAFTVFGEVERALVFVDEKGKSVGEGIVDFTRKNNALMAHRFCSDWCYFLTSDLKPVETEIAEMFEMDEGLLEANIIGPQRQGGFRGGRRDEHNLMSSREAPPRIADEGSFEHEYGMKFKSLVAEYKRKENELKAEMQAELDNLYKKMEIERYDYETEKLREQLRQREMDAERHRMEWEQRERMKRDNDMGHGFNRQFGGREGPGNSRFQGGYQTVNPNQGGGGDNGRENMVIEDTDAASNNGAANFVGIDFIEAAGGLLAPPPIPPSLLDLGTAFNEQDVKWELGPFASASFDEQQQQQQQQQEGVKEDVDLREGSPGPGRGFPGREQIMRDRPRFNDRGGPRGGGYHRGGFNRGGGRGYRGGGRISRN